MNDSVTEAPSASFTVWLIKQHPRKDVIGRLARYVAVDESWPKDATFGEQRDYLVEIRQPRLVPALARAWQQYTETLPGAEK